MKIYLASSWRNEQQPVVLAALRAAGHEVYDFKNPAPGNVGFGWRQCHAIPPPWSAAETIAVLNTERASEGYEFDFGAMLWSDAIVMLQPCGRSAALELGWGCGAGKLTIALLADGQEPELMLRMADHLCTTVEEVIDAIATGSPFGVGETANRRAERFVSVGLCICDSPECHNTAVRIGGKQFASFQSDTNALNTAQTLRAAVAAVDLVSERRGMLRAARMADTEAEASMSLQSAGRKPPTAIAAYEMLARDIREAAVGSDSRGTERQR